MIDDDINLFEVDDEITCYKCGNVLDIEDLHCNNCGTPQMEDLVLL